jgi:hypothetical protein
MHNKPLVYDRDMFRWRSWFLFLGVSAAACGSKANPAATCMQGTCIDPNYPYCDLDGSVGGTPGACIAVTCTAGEFGKCSGDTALTCNQFGTGYDQVDCAHGCDDMTGCKLCEANQTACSNGAVATCDADGNQTSVTQCPLGCFEDQPRCRDVDPSNHLGTYFDMNPTPPDLDLSNGDWYVLNDAAGTISGPQSVTMVVPNYVVTQPAGGPKLHVYVVNNLNLGSVYITGQGGFDTTQATVFLASGDVTVEGTVKLDYLAGSIANPTCSGAYGYSTYAQANGAVMGYGGGGGGAVASGGNGGIVDDQMAGPARHGGSSSGMDNLEPLVGGCAAGGFDDRATDDQQGELIEYGAGGGGALQITSRKTITVNGSINANGALGGGGGGSILLEAPVIRFAASSNTTAVGGDGTGCTPATEFCGARGKGGTSTNAPTAGESLTFVTAAGASASFFAGGGGGSVGRIRVNTPTSSYSADSAAVLDAVVTTGALKTR